MIEGFFRPGGPYPFVRAGVRLGGAPARWAAVEFIVDTGAAVSCIHARDAVNRLHLPASELDPGSWDRMERFAGVGGTSRYGVRACTYGFVEADGTPIVLPGEIRLGELRRGPALPSILGWDVLRHFELAVRSPDLVRLVPLGQ